MNHPLVLNILNVLIRTSEAGQAAGKERAILGGETGPSLCIFDDATHILGLAAVRDEASAYLHVRVHLRQSRARGAKVSS